MELEMQNLDQICRTCKCVAPQMQSLFEVYQNTNESLRTLCIDEMLMACASVQVKYGDGLPSQICQICFEQLKNSFYFKHQCEKIDASLREYLTNIKANEIKQEVQDCDFMGNLLNEQSCMKETKHEPSDAIIAPKIEGDQMLLTCQECFKIFTTIEALKCHKHPYNEAMDDLQKCSRYDKEYMSVEDLQRHEEFFNDEGINIGETCVVCDEGSQENEEIVNTARVKMEDLLETTDNVLADYDDTGAIVKRDVGENSGDSSDTEYLPEKIVSSIKGGRANTRKLSLKIKRPARGRPRKTIKTEEEHGSEHDDLTCPACQEEFVTLQALDEHARIEHKDEKIHSCTVCNKGYNQTRDLRRHVPSHVPVKPFKCPLCPKSFNRKDRCNKHLKLHYRKKDFQCTTCQTIFNSAIRLAKHEASKRCTGEKIVKEKKYKCPLCPQSFTTERYRKKHTNRHEQKRQEGDLQCEVCGKKFIYRSSLVQHTKIHDEPAKKFLCSECGKAFIRKDYLVIHMRRHKGERPFKCKYCEKGFLRKTDLLVHERFHTGEKTHVCTVCGKGFERSSSCTVHMRTHTGERPYQCTYCGVAFKQGNDLKIHVRRHTGERFQCDLCSDNFLAGSLLTRHKRTVHGLNVVSKVRLLKSVRKQENSDEPPPLVMLTPKSGVPRNGKCNEVRLNRVPANSLRGQQERGNLDEPPPLAMLSPKPVVSDNVKLDAVRVQTSSAQLAEEKLSRDGGGGAQT